MKSSRWRTIILCAVVGGFFVPGTVRAKDAYRQIGTEEAKELIKTWLAGRGFPIVSPRFVLDADAEHAGFPDFYFFSAAYEQEQSVPSIGHFAVNRRTADLWDWESCEKLRGRALAAAQKAWRRKLGLSEEEYERLTKTAPCTGQS